MLGALKIATTQRQTLAALVTAWRDLSELHAKLFGYRKKKMSSFLAHWIELKWSNGKLEWRLEYWEKQIKGKEIWEEIIGFSPLRWAGQSLRTGILSYPFSNLRLLVPRWSVEMKLWVEGRQSEEQMNGKHKVQFNFFGDRNVNLKELAEIKQWDNWRKWSNLQQKSINEVHFPPKCC